MSGRVPRHKGTGVLPVVTALRAHPRGREAMPERLRHYLNRQLVATEWYPEADLNALLQSLAHVLEQDGMVDVWDYFGRTAAQRDIKGSQSAIPAERRVKTAGIYRPFAGEEVTAASLLLRLGTLWTLYHDTGRVIAGRGASDDCSAVVRIVDFHLPTTNLVRMQMAYFCEYAGIIGIPFKGRVARATCAGDPFSEWEYTCERRREIVESLALLPRLS